MNEGINKGTNKGMNEGTNRGPYFTQCWLSTIAIQYIIVSEIVIEEAHECIVMIRMGSQVSS